MFQNHENMKNTFFQDILHEHLQENIELLLCTQISPSSTKNFKNLSNAQKHSDDGEYIHCTEEDCLFKVLWNHTLGEVKGLVQ